MQQQQRASSLQSHRQSLRSRNFDSPRSLSHPHPPIRRTDSARSEKTLVVQHAEAVNRREVLPPEVVSNDPQHKKLGFSSRLKVSDFELMRTLGTGTFARVWLCRFANPRPPEQDKVFALKVLKKVDVIKLKQVEHVRNERNILAAVAGHPFITTLITSFSDETSLYLLLQYESGGELFSYLRRARRFPFNTVQFYAAEITLILSYLHDVQYVAYRDLKPENLLLDVDGHLKLVDFGFAKYLPPSPDPAPLPYATPGELSGYPNGHPGASDPTNLDPEKHQLSPTTSNVEPSYITSPTHGAGVTYTLCGTPEYLAPEVIRNSGHGMAVDWWALGILVYEMLIGQPPFWDQNPMRIYEQIVAGQIRFPSSHTQYTSSSGHRHTLYVPTRAKDFILALCKTDPSQRLGHIAGGTQRVMEHYFFDGINWDDIYYRRRRGPIIPRVDWPGDSGNFDEYPDPVEGEESEGGRGRYTKSMADIWEESFKDF